MKRTQLYLDEKIHQDLSTQAKKENRTISDLVRDFVSEGLSVKRVENDPRALLKLAKFGFRGPKNLSKEIDEAVYGS